MRIYPVHGALIRLNTTARTAQISIDQMTTANLNMRVHKHNPEHAKGEQWEYSNFDK